MAARVIPAKDQAQAAEAVAQIVLEMAAQEAQEAALAVEEVAEAQAQTELATLELEAMVDQVTQ